MQSNDKSKYELQEQQYDFPYHHIPHFQNGTPTRVRILYWGMHYLCSIRDMKQTVEGWQPQTVLEIGCGDGAMIGNLDGRIKRVGVDLSARAIKFASAFYPDVDFRAMDAAEVDGEFDVVTVIEVLEHIPDQQVADFMRTAILKTRPGGKLYISVPHLNMPVEKKHHRHYDAALLRQQVESAGLPVKFLVLRPFYNPVWWEKIYRKLTSNRILVAEFPVIEKALWDQVWRQAKIPAPDKAYQMIAEVERL